jgi:phosphoserine phosphatase
MPTFQILYFRENVLAHSEDATVRDLLEAIDKATDKAPDLSAEIRSKGVRVGLVGPSLNEGVRPAGITASEPARAQESEIAEEMKVRLRMVR